MKLKWTKLVIIILSVMLLGIILLYSLIIIHFNKAMKSDFYNISATQHPFYNMNQSMDFIIDSSEQFELKLWWESLTGYATVNVMDSDGKSYFSKTARNFNKNLYLPLESGRYRLEITIAQFTGAFALGYGNATPITYLPNENYRIISGDLTKGYYWDYILYIPERILHHNLLVVPNNTGYVSDYMEIHMERAKDTIVGKSDLADELGVPLLVPVFPRPKLQSELYTHALNRAALLTDIDELKRLDLQLIAMIDDAKSILLERQIVLEDKIIMSGFSASGDFTDRFTLLHPDLVKAAAMGGCDTMLPLSDLNNENLPYPSGIYDYEKINERKFDMVQYKDIHRYIYKGSEDEGGWVTEEVAGGTVKYTGKECFEKYDMPEYSKRLTEEISPIYKEGEVTEDTVQEILYRAFEGKCYIDRFNQTKLLFQEMGLGNNEFVIYKGIGHEITDQVKQDELQFFQKILN